MENIGVSFGSERALAVHEIGGSRVISIEFWVWIGSVQAIELLHFGGKAPLGYGGDQRPEQILRDAPKSAGARGPVGQVPTVGRPAIVAKDAERE
jgi:hypothetical protein